MLPEGDCWRAHSLRRFRTVKPIPVCRDLPILCMPEAFKEVQHSWYVTCSLCRRAKALKGALAIDVRRCSLTVVHWPEGMLQRHLFPPAKAPSISC